MGKGFRQGRIGEEIKKIISSMLLTDLKDPRLSAMISITECQVTRDGSYATCYVTLLSTKTGEELAEEQEQAIEGLNSAKGTIKRALGKELRLRHIPELIFKLDLSMEYGRHIDKVIDSLGMKEDENDDK